MAGINGTLAKSFGVNEDGQSNLNRTNQFEYSFSRLLSVNSPLVFQVVWSNSGLNELTEPSAANYSSANGDVVNILFDIYQNVGGTTPASIADYDLVATVRKSRDIPNNLKRNFKVNGMSGLTTPLNHRFTVDVSEICKDLLSYSLVPIGKGTWTSNKFGGLNGGEIVHDNQALYVAANPYIQRENGAWRNIKIATRAEIIKDDGTILEATTSSSKLEFEDFYIINSVTEYDKNRLDHAEFAEVFELSNFTPTRTNPKSFQTNCPNKVIQTSSLDIGAKVANFKEIRPTDNAEYLQWFQGKLGNGTAQFDKVRIEVEVCDINNTITNRLYLYDFNEFLKTDNTGKFILDQNQCLVQNVSPAFIRKNAISSTSAIEKTWQNGGTIANIDLANHSFYRVSLEGKEGSNVIRLSEYRYYKIDKEKILSDMSTSSGSNPNITFNTGKKNYVKFFWLNTAGGIDSYTAKGMYTESYNINREIIKRNEGNRFNYGIGFTSSANPYTSNFFSDTLRGGDNHKGGREVLSVNADRVATIQTKPMTPRVAEWVREIATSPSVWIETDTVDHTVEGSIFAKVNQKSYSDNTSGIAQDGRYPTNLQYTPVIITNSNIDIESDEQKQVVITFEYTYAHEVKTQRN